MPLVSFQLTMPNNNAWNGKWTGANKKYYVIENISMRYLKSKEWFNDLLQKEYDSWYYNFGDGWGANVRAEIIPADVAKKRRKESAGFCGYEWMIKAIKYDGEINTKY